jgi:hypothetical protein
MTANADLSSSRIRFERGVRFADETMPVIGFRKHAWSRSLRRLDLRGHDRPRGAGMSYRARLVPALASDGRERVFVVAPDRPPPLRLPRARAASPAANARAERRSLRRHPLRELNSPCKLGIRARRIEFVHRSIAFSPHTIDLVAGRECVRAVCQKPTLAKKASSVLLPFPVHITWAFVLVEATAM